MEQEKPQVALYDFLYRDSGRITSYYAQIFGGHLIGLEETDATADTVDKSGGLSAGVITGNLKSTQQDTATNKRITDPHDVRTTDVLSYLADQRQLEADITDAPHGSLVLAKGTVIFVDKSIVALANVAFEMEINNKRKQARTSTEKAEVAHIEQMRKFLVALDIPSGFLLQTADGIQVSGTIKETGMEELISSYYFKHGSAGLSDVYLIGIKETSTYSFTLPNEQLMGVGQIAVQGLRALMFPPDSIMVTPVAMFRKM